MAAANTSRSRAVMGQQQQQQRRRGSAITAATPTNFDGGGTSPERENVKDGLRQLLVSLEPLIRASGSSANLHGMLAYLEEADEGFDKYKMVAWVKERLQAAVGALVAEEVRLQCQVGFNAEFRISFRVILCECEQAFAFS